MILMISGYDFSFSQFEIVCLDTWISSEILSCVKPCCIRASLSFFPMFIEPPPVKMMPKKRLTCPSICFYSSKMGCQNSFTYPFKPFYIPKSSNSKVRVWSDKKALVILQSCIWNPLWDNPIWVKETSNNCNIAEPPEYLIFIKIKFYIIWLFKDIISLHPKEIIKLHRRASGAGCESCGIAKGGGQRQCAPNGRKQISKNGSQVHRHQRAYARSLAALYWQNRGAPPRGNGRRQNTEGWFLF